MKLCSFDSCTSGFLLPRVLKIGDPETGLRFPFGLREKNKQKGMPQKNYTLKWMYLGGHHGGGMYGHQPFERGIPHACKPGTAQLGMAKLPSPLQGSQVLSALLLGL